MRSFYTVENPVFASYCFYAGLLGLKMLLMSPLTTRQRFRKLAFATPEDVTLAKGARIRIDDDVERVRRAHLNDLENVVPFLILAFVYVATNPSLFAARLAFRTFTLARFIHTLVYAVVVVPQPARIIAFFVGWFTDVYLAFLSFLPTVRLCNDRDVRE